MIYCKKKSGPRPKIELCGDQIGSQFERELAAIKRALKGAPFIACGGCLRLVITEFEWVADRRSGTLTTKLRKATAEDLRKEARKRCRFFSMNPRSQNRASIALVWHFEELIHRASYSRSANRDCFVWLRIDSEGTIICASPPLYFGQSRKFGNA